MYPYFSILINTKIFLLKVDPCAASLNSNDVFVLVSQKYGYLWYGKGCIGDERELAKELASRVAPRYANDFIVIPEGKEPKDFWDLLGGIGEYASGSIFQVRCNNKLSNMLLFFFQIFFSFNLSSKDFFSHLGSHPRISSTFILMFNCKWKV